MKKLTAIMACTALSLSFARGADIRKLFLSMPDSIMPMLTANDRLDFLDFMDSGMKAKVSNRLGGESVMTDLSGTSLTVRTSQSSSTCIAVYENRRGRMLICLITTVTADFPDSSVKFYNEDWTPAQASKIIRFPELRDFLESDALKNDSLPLLEVQSVLRLKVATATPDALEFRYTSLDYIGEDAGKYIRWFRPDGLTYRWNGRKFVR